MSDTIVQIPNTKLIDAIPASFLNGSYGSAQAIVTAWNGAVVDTVNKKLLVPFCGGHNDWTANFVFALSCAPFGTWQRLVESSTPAPSSTSVDYPAGSGKPMARHTYNGLAYLPDLQKIIIYSGAVSLNGSAYSDTWFLDPVTGTTTRKADGILGAYGMPLAVAPDGMVYVNINGSSPQNGLYKYNPTTNQWSQLTAWEDRRSNYMTAAFDPIRNDYWMIGGGEAVRYRIGQTITRSVITCTGATSIVSAYSPGFEWDPDLEKFVGWSGGLTLYVLDPVSFVITTRTMTGTNPGSAVTNGTFGRFRRFAPGKYVLLQGISTDVYEITLEGVGAPDVTPPLVSISNPANNAEVNGVISVTANASDDRGVVGVQFKLDGSNLGAEDTSSPYSVSWDTSGSPTGSHVLTAVARDAAGNTTTSDPITVNVKRSVNVSVSRPSDVGGTTTVQQVSGTSNVDVVVQHTADVIINIL